ncbi:MAG: alpha-galactosidase, partial [Planctomycetota bacterium]
VGGEPVATVVTTWLDPETGLECSWEVERFPEAAAADWVLRFRNAGAADTKILEDVQALDVAIARPEGGLLRLHRTNGAPSDPTDFEPRRVALERGVREELGGGGGRSSNKDFPFFKLEAGPVSWIVAVGWSGQWRATVESPDGEHARIRAGLERMRLYLRPGESVRTPRILVFRRSGDTLEANAEFRRLIYERYAARRRAPDGSYPPPLPILFSNTCFTRGGGWLNECDARNQISLIRAYAPLGLEAVVTDAGWFEGGWPSGAGNWTPRRDAYPEGMGPVAAAALESGMVYGLWFEPERVVAGTLIHREHPEWLLSDGSPNPSTYLLDFGRPEARDYIFGVVKRFLDLPGFRFYRQDFNVDPLPFWRANDPPGREGIAEIRHVEGLYAFWERIAAEWPDSIREECAGGGRRIDLETIRRMHIHQESDTWFDDDIDQAQIWGLSQYLPNCVFTTPIARLDDTTFRSTLATSLCVGWIADEPGFDAARARRLLDRYREVRHLLVGAWYPLLDCSRAKDAWMASQYHRPDLGEGLILAFRREASPCRTVEVRLRGLDPEATYELAYDSSGERARARGADLLRSFLLTLGERRSSELIAYRPAARERAPAAEAPRPPDPRAYFRIAVVDEETGRGVPLVELRTTNEIACWTDSAGNVAFYEPGLMGRSVFFQVRSHGYEFPADGFGYRGKALTPVPGGSAVLKIRRRNVAERLYRLTGQGIYRDTWLLGLPAPLREPLLDGEVMGQDSVMSIVYRGKIYWFWGDTLRASYPLGHFGTSGATSELPGRGGLDPAVGVDLRYFVDPSGFSRPVCEVPGTGLKWIGGLMTVPDETGRERLIAKYSIHKSLAEILESGLAIFDDEKEAFVLLRRFEEGVRLYPDGRPFRVSLGGAEYYYWSWPYPVPCVRVRADYRSIADPAAYEAFTPLPAGSAYERGRTRVERGPDGKPAYRWRPATHALDHDRLRELAGAGELREDEAPYRFLDVETGKPIQIGGDANWNPYRRRWILLGLEKGGSTSFLGEVWYAEGDTPLGPWVYARKIVTHDRYSFYWPGHHPFFDEDGGRTVYFEGTYTEAFSGNPEKTPWYNYNQILYRLRLDDPRLVLPVPVYRLKGPAGPRYALRDGVEALGAWDDVEDIPFFAVEPGRPLEGAVAIAARREGGGMRLRALGS